MYVCLSRMWLLDREIMRMFVRVNKKWSSLFLQILITPTHYIVFELEHRNGLLVIKQAFPCANRSVIKWFLSVMLTTWITVCFHLYYGVPNVKYVTLRSEKLPEILCDIFKNECASLILFSCRLWIKCLTHIPTCQTHKTYCAMLIIMWTMLLLLILIALIYCEVPRIYGLFH